MPIYEYVCDECGIRYERVVLSKSQQISCPKCASSRKTVQLSVFSKPAKASSGNGESFTGPGCGCGPRGCGCN